MSQESVKRFFQFLKTDELLQEQLKNTNDTASVIQAAAEKGYEFTEEELQAYTQEAIDTGELSEEDLLAIAGGCSQQQQQQVMA
jgi:predicted ribosomally synthesized peptide with nif11-like leader